MQTERVAQEEEFKELEARLAAQIEAAHQKHEALQQQSAADISALQADSQRQLEALHEELNVQRAAHAHALARHERELHEASIRHKELAEQSAHQEGKAKQAVNTEAAKAVAAKEQLAAAQEVLVLERQARASREQRCEKLEGNLVDDRKQVWY
jgi:hypothetical protein